MKAIASVTADRSSLRSMLTMSSAEAMLLQQKSRLLEAMIGISASLRVANIRKFISHVESNHSRGVSDGNLPSDKLETLQTELKMLADLAQETRVCDVPRIQSLPCKWLEIASTTILYLCNHGVHAEEDAGTAVAIATTELGGLLAACACRIWRPCV